MNSLPTIARVILYVSWPGLVLGSVLILRETLRFMRRIRSQAFGRLVMSMTMGWLVTLYFLGFVASTHLVRHGDKDDIGTMAAVFLLSVVIFGALYAGIRRWNRESIRLNELYAEMESQTGNRMDDLEAQNARLKDVTVTLAKELGENQTDLDDKLAEVSRVTRMLVAREARMHELKLKIVKLQDVPAVS